MKVCPNPKCNKEFEGDNRFCSRSCANIRIHSDDTKFKISQSCTKTYREMMESGDPKIQLMSIGVTLGRDRTSQNPEYNKRRADASRRHNAYLVELRSKLPWDETSETEKWRRVRARGKCEGVGCIATIIWNGNPLTLEVHHDDGDDTNWREDNLKLLCPNCHSQTPNYKTKNKRPVPNGCYD